MSETTHENGGGTKPEFDFTRVGYGWAKKWSRVNARLNTLEAVVYAPEAEGLSAFDKKRLAIARAEYLGELPAATDERDTLFVEVLVSVPQEWLMPGAPTNLDWSDITSLEWLRSMPDLLTSMGEAQVEGQKK